MRVRIAGVAVVVLAVGCGGSPEPPPPAPPPPATPMPDIVRRHWDQVCRPSVVVPTHIRVTELFDTLGLGAQLTERGLRPQVRKGQEWRADFISRYGLDGSLTASGVWSSTVDEEHELAIEEVLRTRAKAFPARLIHPEGFRVRLTLAPWPRLTVAPPVDCMPHMVHTEGKPPIGLPDSVRTWVGRSRVSEGDNSMVSVRLLINQFGEMTEVQHLSGTESSFDEVRPILDALEWDPPLRNGEAVREWLELTFRFRNR
jgi:hypothetical protein